MSTKSFLEKWNYFFLVNIIYSSFIKINYDFPTEQYNTSDLEEKINGNKILKQSDIIFPGIKTIIIPVKLETNIYTLNFEQTIFSSNDEDISLKDIYSALEKWKINDNLCLYLEDRPYGFSKTIGNVMIFNKVELYGGFQEEGYNKHCYSFINYTKKQITRIKEEHIIKKLSESNCKFLSC